MSDPRRDDADQRFAERVSFAIALAIVLALLGLIGHVGTSDRYTSPPQLELRRAGEVRHAGGRWYVPFELRNRGGRSAEGVEIEAVLHVDGAPDLRVPQRFDYLPGHDRARGELVFDRDPAAGQLELRVLSLRLP